MATLLNAIGAAFGPLPTLPSCWYDAEQCLQSMPWKERQMNGCFTFELCCIFDGHLGERCWLPGSLYTYEHCCSLAIGSDNQRHIPFWHSKQVLVKLEEQFAESAAYRERGRILTLDQDVPGTFEGEWQIYQPQNVPLVLWESGYLMMRWLEHKAMTSGVFRGSRVLELGAGIGLAAITATLAGAKVVATDGSSEAVQLMQRNIAANLDNEQAARIRPLHLDWTTIVQGADMDPQPVKKLAMQRLSDAGVSGTFDVVVCAALGYVSVQTFHALLGILDLLTDKDTILFWGAGKDFSLHLNQSRNHDEKAVEMDKAFRILNDLGRDRPSHLNLFELRRRPSWRGAPVFLINDEYSNLGAPTKSFVVVSSVGISSVISPIVAFH
ncbi:mettl21a [Symbiodinium necroappetens]|uniref:Mettl21a protein n=1 Tax=Symbiodinium necroappetens TaxID=1628268 RepID=A0A812JFD2_9DINO|nr:mettl21a [Symbiodinium necroappetens]